jgi:hypothetical protein
MPAGRDSTYLAQQHTLANSKCSGRERAELNGNERDENLAEIHDGKFVRD